MHWRSIPTSTPINARKIIVELNKLCLNNVVTQYGDQLYPQQNGIISGDNHSVALTIIAVHYILQPIAGVQREAALFRRFIDDIIWISASETSNERIQQVLASGFANSGLELTFRQSWAADHKRVYGRPPVSKARLLPREHRVDEWIDTSVDEYLEDFKGDTQQRYRTVTLWVLQWLFWLRDRNY